MAFLLVLRPIKQDQIGLALKFKGKIHRTLMLLIFSIGVIKIPTPSTGIKTLAS